MNTLTRITHQGKTLRKLETAAGEVVIGLRPEAEGMRIYVLRNTIRDEAVLEQAIAEYCATDNITNWTRVL